MTTNDFSTRHKPVKSYPWMWLSGETMKGKIFAANMETLEVLRGN